MVDSVAHGLRIPTAHTHSAVAVEHTRSELPAEQVSLRVLLIRDLCLLHEPRVKHCALNPDESDREHGAELLYSGECVCQPTD